MHSLTNRFRNMLLRMITARISVKRHHFPNYKNPIKKKEGMIPTVIKVFSMCRSPTKSMLSARLLQRQKNFSSSATYQFKNATSYPKLTVLSKIKNKSNKDSLGMIFRSARQCLSSPMPTTHYSPKPDIISIASIFPFNKI